MSTSQRKKSTFKAGRATMLFFTFIVAGAAVVWAAWPIKQRLRQEHQLVVLSRQIKNINAKNKRLSTEIAKLRHDDSYIEWLARSELGLIKNDEEAFVVIDKSTKPDQRSRTLD